MFGKTQTGLDPSKVETIIGSGVEVKGTFISKTTIRIDGRVEGDLQSEGDVILGKEGRVKGNIKARNVYIGGRVNGNSFAESKIEIQPGGQVFGDIKAPIVVIMEGAIFEGHCEMGSKEKGKIVDISEREYERRTARE
jgi:cytoskeletal protein CcmA (bactofilin family)